MIGIDRITLNATAAFARKRLVSRVASQASGIHSCVSQAAVKNTLAKPEGPLLALIRTKVRCYFPRPNETKRVRRHGWVFRMSTPNGRRIIMRRILKGHYVLSH